MPLSDANTIQSNSGSFEGTSGNATLGVGTTAGNTVMLCVGQGGGSQSTPSGFTRVSESPGGSAQCSVYLKSNVGAGESSWTITSGTSAPISWYVEELEGYDLVAPVDAVPPGTHAAGSGGTTATSDTTSRSTTYDGRVIALHTAYLSADNAPATFSGHTGGQAEIADVGAAGATASLGMSVSHQYVQALGTFQSTATASKTVSNWGATVVVLTAAGAKKEPNIAFFWGFKVGAGATGLSLGNAGFRYWDAQVGSPAITASGLQLSASAAAETITSQSISLTGITIKAGLARVKLRFDSALPGADVELARVASASNGPVVLRYVSASSKLGLKVGTGSEVLSDATVSADIFYAVDLRLLGTTTAYTCDWQVDYGAGPVDQTQATFTANIAWSDWTLQLGSPAAATFTVTYAYGLCSRVAGHYPLGEHTMVLLKVDPAGTPTVSGTSANFRRFTSNGTIDGSFDAAAIRDALDEWPPVIGASADGLAVVTAHASDYIELPLQTHQAAPDGSVRAVRAVLPMWAASATAATCRVNGWDGSAVEALFAEADPGADNADPPVWICAMWRPTNGWTQAKLDAAAIRFGAADATPDLGPHAVGVEVAVGVSQTQGLFGTLATQKLDPVTGGVLGVTVDTTTTGQAVDLYYEESGSPTTVPVDASTTHTETIDAPDAPSTNYIALYPDPEP